MWMPCSTCKLQLYAVTYCDEMLGSLGCHQKKYHVSGTAKRSTAQHSTAQHSTAQHSTAQHSTAQHSTAQHSPMCVEHHWSCRINDTAWHALGLAWHDVSVSGMAQLCMETYLEKLHSQHLDAVRVNILPCLHPLAHDGLQGLWPRLPVCLRHSAAAMNLGCSQPRP